MTNATQRAEFIYRTSEHLGIDTGTARQFLRLAQRLHTWAVHECNGTKQREEKQNTAGEWVQTGRVYWYNPDTGNKIGRTRDLETGALKSVTKLCGANGLNFEHQGDPSGYVLKLIKDGREFGVPSEG